MPGATRCCASPAPGCCSTATRRRWRGPARGPRSRPFELAGGAGGLDVPALVVASDDEADPGHPQAVAAAYAERLPRARLIARRGGVAAGLAGRAALARDFLIRP